MVKIRLARRGSKNQPKYRVVAADERFKRDGRFIEILGHYDPSVNPFKFEINDERLQWWLTKGAKPTEAVSRLVARTRPTKS